MNLSDWQYPWVLLLLLLIPLLLFWQWKQKPDSRAVLGLDHHWIKKLKPTWRSRWPAFSSVVYAVILSLLLIALARPRQGRSDRAIYSEGIDIMVALDISESMRAEDFGKENRLETAKNVIQSFIEKRHSDRIGLVVYGKEAFLQCPLTLDHGILLDFLHPVHFIEELSTQTAVGMAIAQSVLSLEKSDAKSKIVILMSDGDNNAGRVDPVTASHLAKNKDIKIYSIGIGKPGTSQVPYTVEQFGIKHRVMKTTRMDEEQLKKIADISGGEYYNAQDLEGLKNIINTIDELEKSEIESLQYLEYEEKYSFFLLLALLLFTAERCTDGLVARRMN